MFIVNPDKSIYITRGDIGMLVVNAETLDNEIHTFTPGDIVRLRVFKKNKHDEVVLQKDVDIVVETQVVEFSLTREDTKLGDIINKPVDYWYEVELNPDTTPQTIIGYDLDGPKIFKLFPEGGDKS